MEPRDRANLLLTTVIALATVVIAINSYASFRVSKELADLNERQILSEAKPTLKVVHGIISIDSNDPPGLKVLSGLAIANTSAWEITKPRLQWRVWKDGLWSKIIPSQGLGTILMVKRKRDNGIIGYRLTWSDQMVFEEGTFRDEKGNMIETFQEEIKRIPPGKSFLLPFLASRFADMDKIFGKQGKIIIAVYLRWNGPLGILSENEQCIPFNREGAALWGEGKIIINNPRPLDCPPDGIEDPF